MKVKSTITRLLTNRTVLNVVFVIALLNIIGYLMIGSYHEIAQFILVALLTSYFSKNMIVVLGVPMLIVNLFARVNTMREGLENPEKEDKTATNVKKETNGKKTNAHADDTETDAKKEKNEEPFEVGRQNGASEIDYASTVQDAYADLNNILGSDGIKRLTNDTQNLMKQQVELTKAMQGMGPLMEGLKPLMSQATQMMGSLKGEGGLKDLMGMANQLKGQ
jgi:hypothetical protein